MFCHLFVDVENSSLTPGNVPLSTAASVNDDKSASSSKKRKLTPKTPGSLTDGNVISSAAAAVDEEGSASSSVKKKTPASKKAKTLVYSSVSAG
jgi:hypothetical protein